jgi:glutamate carboxypeptidase
MARVVLTLHGCTDMESGTTVNVGVVQGGTRYNVVAAHAQADIDVRVVSKEEGTRMDAFVRALKPRNPEANFEIAGSMLWPPMERSDAIKELFAKAVMVAKEHLDLELHEAAVGGASDGCTCAALGLPVLDGMGAVGAGAHAANEHIDLRYVAQRSALAAHLLSEL